ncbi:MAG: hypothetical protein ACREFP_05995 [Acetobacteraceae bacterium]
MPAGPVNLDKGPYVMKILYGAALGALLLAAPAVAMAGAGGGGMAGVVVHPATSATPGISAGQPQVNFGNAETTANASTSPVARDITAISQALSGGTIPPYSGSTLLANQGDAAAH